MLHRPYIRKDVIQAVEDNAPRSEDGRFLDVNTGKPIDGKYDLGHKPGHEFWREQQKAEQEGLSQCAFNERMNDPSIYQIEDPSNNRSHRFEDHSKIESYAPFDGQLKCMRREPDFDGLLNSQQTPQTGRSLDQTNSASTAANTAQSASNALKGGLGA